MSRRKKLNYGGGETVKLNLAAMLDMAFQLLTFFILTFKPAPVEGQIMLRMPPPRAAMSVGGTASTGSQDKSHELLEHASTLTISVLANREGNIGALGLGDATMGNVSRLSEHLHMALAEANSPYQQVIIQAGSGLRYDALMQVVNVCTRQKLPSGRPLTKLSFVEVPDGR